MGLVKALGSSHKFISTPC